MCATMNLMLTIVIWVLVTCTSMIKVKGQQTFLDDATLCKDVRDFHFLTRTLQTMTEEFKSLRISLKSMEETNTKLAKEMNENGRTLLQTIKGMNSSIAEKIITTEKKHETQGQSIGSQMKVLSSTLDNHDGKVDLAIQKLDFEMLKKFTATDTADRAALASITQHIMSSEVSLATKFRAFETRIKHNFSATFDVLQKEQIGRLDLEMKATRTLIETFMTSINKSLHASLDTMTTTTLDYLRNIKDTLNHHHVATRLVGGTGAMNGRVEVFLNGVWGTICDDDWGDDDAKVVCRALGFCNGTAKLRGFYGIGTGPVILDNVACKGTEKDIFDCPHNGLGIEDCGRFEDAAVQCDQC